MGRKRPLQQRRDQHMGHTPDPLVRVLAVHPSDELVVLAVGPNLRIVNVKEHKQWSASSENGHTGAVRFLAFSPCGQLVLSGADDKTAKLWDTNTWKCIATWRMTKKVSAGAFSRDSQHALFADKFGDVVVAACKDPSTGAPSADAQLLMGHLCSVVSSVAVTHDNRYVVSSDKDGKVRVSVLPEQPLLGSYEIEAFCLGHTAFVSSCAPVPPATSGDAKEQGLLVTGSGDGTVRLWLAATGQLLDTFVAAQPRTTPAAQQQEAQQEDAEGQQGAGEAAGGEQEGEQQEEDDEEEDGEEEEEEQGAGGDGDAGTSGRANQPDCAAVLNVAVSPDGSLVVALVEGEHEVQVLALDRTSRKLSLRHKLTLPGVSFPCEASFDAQGRLWVVGGPPLDTSSALHVGVAQQQQSSEGGVELVPCTDACLPAELRAAVEQRNDEEEAQLAAGTLSVALSQPLQRKRYDPEQVQQRKKFRNDYRETERLAVLAAEKEKEKAAQEAAAAAAK